MYKMVMNLSLPLR